MRRRKSFGAQAKRYGAARLGEQTRKALRREPLVRARDGEQHRIHDDRFNAVAEVKIGPIGARFKGAVVVHRTNIARGAT